MQKIFFPIFLAALFLLGCGYQNTSSSVNDIQSGGQANVFNPWMNKHLPNMRSESAESKQMLNYLGAKSQSIEGEASHRKYWREEIYPIVFGKKEAPKEIIVILDFADQKSESIWNSVVQASKSINPNECKIVVFARNTEPYGTDLMGLAIWIAYSRPNQAMQYLSYALKRWNDIKSAQKNAGNIKNFVNEYDATASPSDLPIHYTYFRQLQPPVPANQELSLGKYCFDAGNVNMFQASQICQYYGVKSIPAVIVDGKIIANVTTDSIISALK